MSIEGNGLLICSYGMWVGLLPWIVIGVLAVPLRRRLPAWAVAALLAIGVGALGIQMTILWSAAQGRLFLFLGASDFLCFNGFWVAIVGWIVVALLVAFRLRTALPAWLVATSLSVAGAGMTWIWVIRRQASLGEARAAALLMAVLVPAHVRIVLGRFGPPREAIEPAPRAPSGG